MNKTRQHYTPEFKAQVVLEVLREEKTVQEIASAHKLHPNLLTRWKTEFVANMATAFSKEEADAAKIQQRYENREAELYKQIGQLTTKLTWLKKKCAHLPFAKGPDGDD